MSGSKKLWRVGGTLLACLALFLVLAAKTPSADEQKGGKSKAAAPAATTGLTLCNLSQPPDLGAIAKAITTNQSGTTQFISDYNTLSQAAWCTFIALNWAAQGTSPTMTANPGVAFGQQASNPVVWETWLESTEVYCSNGGTPGSCTVGGATTHTLRSVNPNTDTDTVDDLSENTQATGFVLPDKNNTQQNQSVILYEVKLNPSVVTFLQTPQQSLYNLDQQVAFYNTTKPGSSGLPPGQTPIDFPPTAFEVKSSWYLPTAAEISSNSLGLFLRPICTTDDCSASTGTGGMTGFHVLWKVFPKSHWLWMTFEYVNNPTLTPIVTGQQTFYPAGQTTCFPSYTNAPCTQGPLPPSGPLPSDPVSQAASALNAIVQPMLQGTPFANFKLIGVQVVPVLNGTNTMVANNHIETDFGSTQSVLGGAQSPTSSCISCHFNAGIGPVTNCPTSSKPSNKPRVYRLPVCTNSPCTTGFIGNFQPSLYGTATGGLNTNGPSISTDFVWSMKLATWQNQANSGCPPVTT
ncbi:MAG: hypothetical protein ACJ759_16175 [Thermoanaerobaculia bacterium]